MKRKFVTPKKVALPDGEINTWDDIVARARKRYAIDIARHEARKDKFPYMLNVTEDWADVIKERARAIREKIC